jgi:anti-sigma factor RsiW
MDHVTDKTHISDEDLSLYLDDALDDRAAETRIAQHLEQCGECRERLADLQTITTLLARLPEPALPRSFRLAEKDLPRPTAPALIEPWFVRFQPAIRSAAAVAAVLLLTVIGVSLVLDTTTGTDDAISMMEAVPEERAVEEDAAADQPDEDADVGVAAVPEEGEADSPEPFSQVTAADDSERGIGALWIVGALLAAATVALGFAGFVLPRWWSRSQQGRA